MTLLPSLRSLQLLVLLLVTPITSVTPTGTIGGEWGGENMSLPSSAHSYLIPSKNYVSLIRAVAEQTKNIQQRIYLFLVFMV